jgi:PAS domain-containing protein
MQLSYFDNSIELSEKSTQKQYFNGSKNQNLLLEKSESLGELGFWEYDIIGESLWFSKGARVIFGINERDITLKEIHALAPSEYRSVLDNNLENLVLYDEKYEFEYVINRMNDGALVHIRTHAEYDFAERRIYGIIQDISSVKRLKKELSVATERNCWICTFTGRNGPRS